jgi:hypothetical protein
MRIKKTEN